MATYSEEFGEAVRALMDQPGRELSTREIARRSRGRLSTGTVLAMRDGKVVGPELIVELGLAVKTDPNYLLDKAGIRHLRYVEPDDARVRHPLGMSLRPAALGGEA